MRTPFQKGSHKKNKPMAETIYTIPINEVFEAGMEEDTQQGCPFCTLTAKLESEELDLILGASMMEPDIRIKTNQLGFCPDHFSKMLRHGKRLPLALMLESHLQELQNDTMKKGVIKSPEKAAARVRELNSTCYICSRTDGNYYRMLANAAYMWGQDFEFRKKFSSQPWLCGRHFADICEVAKKEVGKRLAPDLCEAAAKLYGKKLSELSEEVSRFCRSFNHSYSDEPIGNASTSVERTIEFLK